MEPLVALAWSSPQRFAVLDLVARLERTAEPALAAKVTHWAHLSVPARWQCNQALPRRSHLLSCVPGATCVWDLAVPHRAARSYTPAPAARCVRKPEQQPLRRHREDTRQPANPAPPAR